MRQFSEDSRLCISLISAGLSHSLMSEVKNRNPPAASSEHILFMTDRSALIKRVLTAAGELCGDSEAIDTLSLRDIFA